MNKFEFFLTECKLYNPNILSGYKLCAGTEEARVYNNNKYNLHINLRNDGTVTARVTELYTSKTKSYESKLCPTKFVEFMKPYA
jgi:hypothetical protein